MPDGFYIWEDGERNGPYTEVQVGRMLEDEIITFAHECEDARTGKRVPLDELFEAFDEEEEEGGDEEIEEWDESEEWDEVEDEDEEDGGIPPGTALFYGHPTLLRYVGGLALAALGIGFGLWLGPRGIWFFVGGFGVAVISLSAVLIDRSSRVYIVTPRRVELIWGLFARSSREALIEDIRTINVRRAGFAGLLGVGTVEFSSTGDGVDVEFADIWSAQRVKNLVRELQDELG